MDTKSVDKYQTSDGRCIYTFPVQAFSQLVANIYLISDGDRLILVDTGSGMDQSNSDLLAGMDAIRETYGETVSLSDLDGIIITHGHIDHFGGLPFVRQHSQAPIGVHVLDRRVLTNYEERVIVAANRLETFLSRAGVEKGHRQNLMAMYLFAKGIYRSTDVQFLLDEAQMAMGELHFIHVPGHCPGQVCVQVDDIVLTADHILSRTTPHQAPESITNHMGLAHYLSSLDKMAARTGFRLGLGGHERPMTDVADRIGQIKRVHEERLDQVLAICRHPKSTADVSRELFGAVAGYHVLLALEEAGAHVEYLYQRGELVADNLEEIESNPNPVIRYRYC
jgi:glyoxylase-like metal-dependent hydrolase (beta-lactamase superfamily II)